MYTLFYLLLSLLSFYKEIRLVDAGLLQTIRILFWHSKGNNGNGESLDFSFCSEYDIRNDFDHVTVNSYGSGVSRNSGIF